MDMGCGNSCRDGSVEAVRAARRYPDPCEHAVGSGSRLLHGSSGAVPGCDTLTGQRGDRAAPGAQSAAGPCQGGSAGRGRAPGRGGARRGRRSPGRARRRPAVPVARGGVPVAPIPGSPGGTGSSRGSTAVRGSVPFPLIPRP